MIESKFGELELDESLEEGEYREITAEELAKLTSVFNKN